MADRARDVQDGLTRINHAFLLHKLHVRGKAPGDLREAKACSFDTLAKIRRGEPVKVIVLHRIITQLCQWPELEYAEGLLAVDGGPGGA
jgi:hypothetical protein